MYNIPNKITELEKIPKTSEIVNTKENLYASVFAELVSSLASVTPKKNAFLEKIRLRKHNLF